MRKDIMNGLDKIAEEKARLAARIAKDRAALADLEAYERVHAKFVDASVARPAAATGRRRGRPPRALPAKVSENGSDTVPSETGPTAVPGVSASVLATIAAAPEGITRQSVIEALRARARPNHIGLAIVRHVNKGRVIERDGALFPA
jgi:hypothetical protein